MNFALYSENATAVELCLLGCDHKGGGRETRIPGEGGYQVGNFPTGWAEWNGRYRDDERKQLLEFTKKLVAIRRVHPALHRAKFFRGRRIRGTDVRDIMWYRHDGPEMTDQDWTNPVTASLGLFLAGRGIDDLDDEGNHVVVDDFFMILNGSDNDLPSTLPRASTDGRWQLLIDTADEPSAQQVEHVDQGQQTKLVSRSMKLFIHYAKG